LFSKKNSFFSLQQRELIQFHRSIFVDARSRIDALHLICSHVNFPNSFSNKLRLFEFNHARQVTQHVLHLAKTFGITLRKNTKNPEKQRVFPFRWKRKRSALCVFFRRSLSIQRTSLNGKIVSQDAGCIMLQQKKLCDSYVTMSFIFATAPDETY
jgi:hypothetical protein